MTTVVQLSLAYSEQVSAGTTRENIPPLCYHLVRTHILLAHSCLFTETLFQDPLRRRHNLHEAQGTSEQPGGLQDHTFQTPTSAVYATIRPGQAAIQPAPHGRTLDRVSQP